MKDRASGKSRGFGFVTFWNAADAQRVLECAHIVDGRRCEARAPGLGLACSATNVPAFVTSSRPWCPAQGRARFGACCSSERCCNAAC